MHLFFKTLYFCSVNFFPQSVKAIQTFSIFFSFYVHNFFDTYLNMMLGNWIKIFVVLFLQNTP